MNAASHPMSRSIRLYYLAALTAVELLMSFSFLGYVHVEPISVTIAYIPVLLAGALLGPLESAFVGAVFGVASMWKASASYVMAFDQLFSPFMSGRPVESLLLSVGARALFGLAVGLLYRAAERSRYAGAAVALVSFFGPSIHSSLVYTALWIFFPSTGYTPLNTLKGLPSVSGLTSAAVSAALVLVCWRGARSRSWQQFLTRVDVARSSSRGERYHIFSLVCIAVVALLSSVAVAFYFVNRMEQVLAGQGVSLSVIEYADLIHLQIQFLIGILAMMGLVILFLIFNRRYTTYMNREAGKDALTGVLNRRAFFQSCARVLRDTQVREDMHLYFIMVDLDHFKQINDRHGHPEGDRALREAAQELETVFGRDALVGRLGGDEFAMLLCTPMTREELERELQRFQERLHRIRFGEESLSCSIGAQSAAGETAEQLYRKADGLLYQAKQQGKDRYAVS